MDYGDHGMFHYDPDTREVEPIIMDVEIRSELAFSSDEGLLYSSDNSIDLPEETPNPDGTHAIRVYKALDGRLCRGGRDFVTIHDGIRVDELGDVWSAEFSGIHMYSPVTRSVHPVG